MTMVVGVDVTVVDRIAGALRRNPRFAQRIYTDAEQRYAAAKPERWASRWAAKEAVKKLYGSMGERMPAYKDIEVVRRRGGAPQVHVRGEPTDIALSLTHDGGLAIAVAVNRTGGRRHALPEASGGLRARGTTRRREQGHVRPCARDRGVQALHRCAEAVRRWVRRAAERGSSRSACRNRSTQSSPWDASRSCRRHCPMRGQACFTRMRCPPSASGSRERTRW